MKITSIFRSTLMAVVALGIGIASTPSFARSLIYKEYFDSGLFCGPDRIYGDIGVQVCAQSKGRWMEITMPNGNINYMLKGTAVISVNHSGYISTTTIEINEKMLFKLGQERKGHSFMTANIVNSLNGECTTYSIDYDTFFSNGDVIQKNHALTSTRC